MTFTTTHKTNNFIIYGHIKKKLIHSYKNFHSPLSLSIIFPRKTHKLFRAKKKLILKIDLMKNTFLLLVKKHPVVDPSHIYFNYFIFQKKKTKTKKTFNKFHILYSHTFSFSQKKK